MMAAFQAASNLGRLMICLSITVLHSSLATAQAMAVCAAPAVGCMLMALTAPGRPEMELNAVWQGLTVLMAMRSLTIYIPYRLRRSPFDKVFLYPREEMWED